MKRVTSFFLLFFAVFLTACSKDSPKTQVFPPNLSFSSPDPSSPSTEEELTQAASNLPEKKQLIPEFATCSSVLLSMEGESYHASYTIDGDESTAWVEGASGFGVGEWLQFHYQWPVEVQEIWFYNGHGGSMGSEFAEIREVSISLSSGEEWIYGVLPGWNAIVLPEVKETTLISLTILNASTTSGENSCISEVKIFNLSHNEPTEELSKEVILSNMGALGDCSNITPAQAAAFAEELQRIMNWAESTSAERAVKGDAYAYYTGEALLFAGGDGVPVLYYDYDFPLGQNGLFTTKTDLVAWNGYGIEGEYFEKAGAGTNINWVLPGNVYQRHGQYFFGLTEYDLYGSGTFGLMAMVGFQGGMPADEAAYVAFLSHPSTGAYTYDAELKDYLQIHQLRNFPTHQLATLVVAGEEAYFEYNGVNFVNKNLVWNPEDYNTWYAAILQARAEAGYEQVTTVQSGATVLAGLLALASESFA